MNHRNRWPALGLVLALLLPACGNSSSSNLNVEKLEEVKPSLPEVPTLPPPPYPVQYEDQSYSLYGLRKRARQTLDTDVTMTGYIVEVFTAPECPQGRTCPAPSAPHLWLADSREERDADKRILLTGYAENQAAIDEAVALAARGRTPALEEGQLAIPTDFLVGAKVKITARFARVSGSGFSQSEGLLEYRAHTTIEPGQAPTAAAPRR